MSTPKKIQWARICFGARYLLPVLSGVLLLVLSFFYGIEYYQAGRLYHQSLWNFYAETLRAGHRYLGAAEHAQGLNAYYGWLCAGAVVGILLYLIGLLVAGCSAYLALLCGKLEPGERKRRKILLRVFVPNRIALFLYNCLFAAVAAFPHYFAFVSARAARVAVREMLFIEYNIPLVVTAALALAMLVLAIAQRFVPDARDPFSRDTGSIE